MILTQNGKQRTSKPIEKVWRWGSGSFTRSRPELNARRLAKSLNVDDRSTIPNIWRPLEWFKSKEIVCHTSRSREMSKGTKWSVNCCFKDKRKSFLHRTGCIDHRVGWWKMNTLRKFKAQKITVQTRQIINIDGKAEYSWRQALHLGSAGYSVLWAAST